MLVFWRLTPSRYFISKLLLLGAGLVALGALISQPGWAQSSLKTVPSPFINTEWDSLSSQEQSNLAPLRSDWTKLDTMSRLKWMEVASRLHQMPAAESKRVRDRMQEWSQMTPEQRGQARIQYQVSQNLSDLKQEKWVAYQSLTNEERKALANRAQDRQTSQSKTKKSKMTQRVRRSTIVINTDALLAAQSIAPGLLQTNPGASTSLVNSHFTPPWHQQVGLPKIAVGPEFVDPVTLLPRRGPQAAKIVQQADPIVYTFLP